MKFLARLAFWCFALLVFTFTHWPNLKVTSQKVPRVDLAIHSPTFAAWTFLLILTGYFASAAKHPLAQSRGVRGWLGIVLAPRAVLISAIVAFLYATFDEATQSIPGLGRTAAWDDFAANTTGIVVMACIALVAGRFFSRFSPVSSSQQWGRSRAHA